MRSASQKLDPNKTVFVGGLHGMINAGNFLFWYLNTTINLIDWLIDDQCDCVVIKGVVIVAVIVISLPSLLVLAYEYTSYEMKKSFDYMFHNDQHYTRVPEKNPCQKTHKSSIIPPSINSFAIDFVSDLKMLLFQAIPFKQNSQSCLSARVFGILGFLVVSNDSVWRAFLSVIKYYIINALLQ